MSLDAQPPIHHHISLTRKIIPSTAQSTLSAFLARTPTNPHLHPDSILSTTGIHYSAHSGPSGGLAIHHLKRIEAGLRGENLVAESEEELRRFSVGNDILAKDEGQGDDEVLDGLIGQTEKNERKKKRKRKEAIADWAEDTSSSQVGGSQDIDARAMLDDAEDPREYAQRQEIVEGELGEREGAPVSRHNVEVPEVGIEDGRGRVHRQGGPGGGELTKEEKKARKMAKKERNKRRA